MSLRPATFAFTVFLSLPLPYQLSYATTTPATVPDPANSAPYLRFPSAHGEQLVFTAEGDLWLAGLQGGLAQRLTTFRGEESQAAISPDGKQVAFLANYDGPNEVYVMPLTGGLPRRLSFESTGSAVLGWSAQGEIMYSVQSALGPNLQRVVKLVSPTTLQRRTLPLHDVAEASVDASGKTLFFSRLGLSTRFDNARRYRGGVMAQIWRYELGSDKEARLLSSIDAVDKQPMWFQGRVYFTSDRDGSDNLWSMLPDGSDAKQVSFERAFDVRNASLNAKAGHIVYQLGADVKVLDIASGKANVLQLRLQSDFEQVRERIIAQPLDYLTHTNLGHNGERVALTVRGKIFVVGLSSSRRQEVVIPPGSRAKNAVLAPDGKTVYAIVDASGEQEIWRFSITGGLPQAKQLSSGAPTYRMDLALSPDGKKLAHFSKEGQIWILDLLTHKNTLVQELRASDIEKVQWSNNSAMLAITRDAQLRPVSQVWLYDLASGKLVQVTSDKYSAHSPSFSVDGNWLYLIGERTFQALSSSPWGDRQMGPFFDKRGKIYAYALQPGLHFPFQAKTELDGVGNLATAKSAAKKTDAGVLASGTDLTNVAERLYEVPAPAANYRALENDGKRLYWLETEAGSENQKRATLKSLLIDNSGATSETLISEVSELSLSGDQKKLLVQKFAREGAGDLLLLDAGSRVTDATKQTINLKNWSLSTQPALEWQQMFDDAWRMQRDFFFDSKMRGLDWQQMRQKYRPLLARVRDKYELNDLLAIMMSELGALHSQIAPGDVRKAEPLRVPSFLGASFERVASGYRIEHIYRFDSELPHERAPLAQHDFQIGDVITHINSHSVLQADDIAPLLSNQVGQQVLINYLHQGQAKSAVVTPVNAERNTALRYGDWEWARQQQVTKLSQGRIGYLHLRQMLGSDLNAFAREFYANLDREGLIIDVRRNGGGNIDSWIVEKLLRRAWGYWQRRNGSIETHPQQSFRGHLVVLADELTYSDGETFVAAVKALSLGTVIGKRTSGAGVWLSDDNNLLDKGRARAAEFPQYILQSGQWHIEGVGVAPDIKVENFPHASYLGKDAQLEAALEFLSKKIKESPPLKLQAQPIP